MTKTAPAMNWTQRSLLALAALALLGTLWIALGPTLPSAQELLEDARAILAHRPIDEEAALRRLEAALAMAEAQGDIELEAEVLLTRGQLLLSLGAYESARTDFKKVLNELLPGDPATRRFLVQTSEAVGDYATAVAELGALLRDEPEYAPAWVESGALHRMLATARLEDCARELDLVLTISEARRVMAQLARLAAMDPSDPARTAIELELHDLIPEKDEERLAMSLVLTDAASLELRAARQDFVRSLSHGLHPEAVAGLLEILIEAGQLGRAIEFGIVATTHPEVASDQRVAALLIRSLLERGEFARAGALADAWLQRSEILGLGFLHLLAEALYKAENWRGLQRCEGLINRIGNANDRELALLYRGLAMLGSGEGMPAMMTLRAWLRQQPPEPWPGALLELWQGMATAARRARDPLQERNALNEVVRSAPDADGEAWLRLTQLQMQSDHASLKLALGSLAHAIRLLPEKRAMLLEQFSALGEKSLAAESLTMDFVFQDVARQGRLIPRGDATPYVLLQLASRHQELGGWIASTLVCERLLEQYPGFPPALDLTIEAHLRTQRTRDAAELAIQRLERTGPDETTQGFFERLATFAFTPEQIVRIMRADPEHDGRRRVAQRLHENGDLEGALRCLRETGGPPLEPAEQILATRILVDVGRYPEALELLGGMPAKILGQRQVLSLALTAALHTRDQPRIDALVKAIRTAPQAAGKPMLAIAIQLLRMGQAQRALELLEQLDRPGGRSGESLLALGMARLAAGDQGGAQLAIDRAEAFLDPLPAALAHLVAAGMHRDWRAAESTARQLLDGRREEISLINAALALVAGETALTLEMARTGLATDVNSIHWNVLAAAGRAAWSRSGDIATAQFEALFGTAAAVQTELFVRGSELHPHDPREVALVLLAMEQVLLAPWAAAYLQGAAPDRHGELWPALLEARTLVVLGEQAEARLAMQRVTERFPTCLQAWREREVMERKRVGSGDHPDLRRLRRDRLQALGTAQPESPEGLLLRSREALSARLAEAAASLATRATELRENWPEAHAARAAALARLGDYAGSIAAWRRACLEAPADQARAWLPGFLETLPAAERAVPPAIHPDQTLVELQRLAAHLPRDPRVALALAELELRRDPRNPALGVARAYARLDVFRREHRQHTLAELQPGAASEWARFYLTLDPRVARSFLEAERLREPGNVDLWVMLGRVLREQGELAASREALELSARMCASPEVYVELATTLLEQSSPPQVIATTLQRAIQLSGGTERPLHYDLLAIASFVRQMQPGSWESAVRQLAPLWRRELASGSDRARRECGWIYVQALLLRDGPQDRALAQEVAAEIEPLFTDPYQRTLLAAFAGLASRPRATGDSMADASAEQAVAENAVSARN